MIKLISEEQFKPRSFVSFITTLKFVVFGIFWIVLSDFMLFNFHLPINGFSVFHAEVFMAIALVIIMGIIVFLAVQTKMTREMKFSDKDFFLTNPIPMWVYDLKTLEFLDVNDAAIKCFGYSRQEFLSLSFSKICLSDNGSSTENKTYYQLPGKNMVCCKDGAFAKVELFTFNTLYKKRECGLIVSSSCNEPVEKKIFIDNDFLQEINDRIAELTLSKKELEVRNREINAVNDELINLSNLLQRANKRMVTAHAEAMQLKNDQIKQTMEQVDYAMWCIDLTGKEENIVNSATLKLFGIAKEKVQDCPNFWLSFIHPDEKEIVLEQLRVLEKVSNAEVTFQIMDTERKLKRIQQQVTITRNESGKDIRINFVAREVPHPKNIIL